MSAMRGRVKLITFEAQCRVDQTWRTEAVLDDRPSAVAEAERLLEAKRPPAVRVIQVVYDTATAECTEFTVFRATRFDEESPRMRRRVIDQEIFEWGNETPHRHDPPSRGWFERHWPDWAPDWATTVLALSVTVLLASLVIRWV
jgi:hypothetical protein